MRFQCKNSFEKCVKQAQKWFEKCDFGRNAVSDYADNEGQYGERIVHRIHRGRFPTKEYCSFNRRYLGRCGVGHDDEPWFVAADVCRALGLE